MHNTINEMMEVLRPILEDLGLKDNIISLPTVFCDSVIDVWVDVGEVSLGPIDDEVEMIIISYEDPDFVEKLKEAVISRRDKHESKRSN